MAIVKKTLQNLKPGKQYLLTVRAKDADLNNTLDPSAAIRFTVPTDQVEPTSLGNLQISVGYKTAMVSFNPADDLNLKNYEYKVYKESQVEQIGLHYEPISEDDYEIQGFSSSNVFTVNLEETSYIEQGTFVENVTDSTITTNFEQIKAYYFVKVRSITTSGVASSWTPLQKSGQIPFIPSAHIQELSASRITSGYIGSAQIILTGSDSVIKSASYKPEVGNLRATLSTTGTEANKKLVTLTQGTTNGLYPGMFFFIPGVNLATPNVLGPGRFGSNSQISSIVDETNFTATVNHSVAGLVEFTCYAKGWNITGDGRVNFGGIQGITFDGSQVRIGSDAIIDPGASLPEANIFSVTSGAQSLVIGNRSGVIGLKISDTASGNVNNNYWYVNGSFKVGNATKNISYDATTDAFNISGEVTIGGTSATTVASNAALGAENPATRINSNSTIIKGGLIRTGTIESTGFSWPNTSSTYSSVGTRIDLDNGQIVSKNFRIDGSGNASFSGYINATSGNLTGKLTVGNVQVGNNLTDANGSASDFRGIVLSNIKGSWTNTWLERGDGTVYFRATSNKSYLYMDDTNAAISLGNGAFYVDNEGNLTAQKGNFLGQLEGATGYVKGDFRVLERLRVGDGAAVDGTTVCRVQGVGNTATNRYPFVVEKLDGTNTFTVREDGRVDVLVGSLYVGGTIVSLSGHSHAYLPSSGGTLTGTLIVSATTYAREINITAGYDINATGTGSSINGATVSGSIVTGTNFNPAYVTLGNGYGVKSDWSPNTDNTYDLGQDNTATGSGSADKRWKRLYSNNTSISTSDIRLKKDIEDASLGLDFIETLRPVSYKFIVGSNEIEKDQNGNPIIIGTDEKGGEIYRLKPIPGVRRHWGFIAQEVKEVIDQFGVEDFAGWSISNINDPDSKQSLSYEQFISPLVKAVQELSQKVKELELKIQS